MAQQQNQGQQSGEQAEEQGTDALDELDEALGQEDEQGAGDGGEEWTAPTREQWQAQQDALEAEKAKLAKARAQAKRLREEKAAAAGQGQPQEGAAAAGAPTGPDPQLTVWQQRAVRASAKAELLNRGADPEMVDLALGRLKADQIEFSEDDEPDLDEWLDEIQQKYPKLFTKPGAEQQPAAGARRPAAGVDQGRSGQRQPAKRRFGEEVLARSQQGSGRRRMG